MFAWIITVSPRGAVRSEFNTPQEADSLGSVTVNTILMADSDEMWDFISKCVATKRREI